MKSEIMFREKSKEHILANYKRVFKRSSEYQIVYA